MAEPMSVSTNRRTFLKGGAGLVFMIGAGGLVTACTDNGDTSSEDGMMPNIWLRIAADGRVTIQYPATEMGQGTMTALPAVLAEELDADWSKVEVETVRIHDTAYGNPIFGSMLYTAGSATLEGYFDIMRRAGAQARKLLIEAAATHWSVVPERLDTEPGVVIDRDSDRRLGYGEIAAFARPDTLPKVTEADFKPRAAYRLLGRDLPRLDLPAKVDGSAEYGMDVQVPGMVHAAVLHAPVEGERPLEIDDSAARAIPGVSDVVSLDSGVAVIGDRVEAVMAGKAALTVTWSEDSPFRTANSEDTLGSYDAAARDLSQPGAPWRQEDDAPAAIAGAARVMEASFLTDYTYHAQMEPLAATASVSEDGKSAEIRVGTQTQSLTILGAAQALDTSPDRISLHPLYMGGGFGRRAPLRQQHIDDALFLARAIGKPVKVIWSREDDVKRGAFRPAAAQHLRAGLDENGRIVGWHHRVATPSVIAYMNPLRWEQTGGKDIVSMLGADSANYTIPAFLAEHVVTERQARICAWRGVATSYTKFAAESFIDEIAAATGRDPLDLRLELCRDHPRAQAVLRRAAEMAGWPQPPGENTALGMGLASYKDGSVSAGIAEIRLDRESGEIRVTRVWMAAEAGLIAAPSNATAQIEGNIVWGISSSLKERISIIDGQVEQNNFYDYNVLRMADMPEIKIDLLPSEHPPSGIGELGLATLPPAIANAFAALTGKRLRRMTFTPERVLAALTA